MTSKKHILHTVYRFSTGGLENGLVNLINGLSQSEFDHTILSLTEADNFKNRLTREVPVICLNKKPGPLLAQFWKIVRIMKEIQPDILHTRNLATLECQMMGWAADIPIRVHSEHGRDQHDVQGLNKKTQFIRKSLKGFSHRTIALSKDLESYLIQTIGVPAAQCAQIYNGVDTQKFKPRNPMQQKPFVVLSVGRLDPVKNFPMLIKAFAQFSQSCPYAKLWLVGDGGERGALESLCEQLGIREKVQFWGNQQNVLSLFHKAHIYVQTSLFEGISNTLLEAMSCAKCIVATDVGGNRELIENGTNGVLIESNDEKALQDHLNYYWQHPQQREGLGHQARQTACQRYGLDRMIQAYRQVYLAKELVACAES